jgi:hypothetical protein
MSWRFHKVLLLSLASIAQLGCLMTPVHSIYYEPNPQDGRPERSTRAYERKDTSVREIEGINVRVHAEFAPSKPLIVGISVIYGEEDVDVNAELIELSLPPDGKQIRAQRIISQDATRYDSKHLIKMFALTFNETVAVDEIAVMFFPGSVMKNGKVVIVEPFRFIKVSKADIHVY